MVIDEALELARQFSGDESVSFINGVLDAVHRGRGVNPLRVVLVSPRNPLEHRRGGARDEQFRILRAAAGESV